MLNRGISQHITHNLDSPQVLAKKFRIGWLESSICSKGEENILRAFGWAATATSEKVERTNFKEIVKNTR